MAVYYIIQYDLSEFICANLAPIDEGGKNILISIQWLTCNTDGNRYWKRFRLEIFHWIGNNERHCPEEKNRFGFKQYPGLEEPILIVAANSLPQNSTGRIFTARYSYILDRKLWVDVRWSAEPKAPAAKPSWSWAVSITDASNGINIPFKEMWFRKRKEYFLYFWIDNHFDLVSHIRETSVGYWLSRGALKWSSLCEQVFQWACRAVIHGVPQFLCLLWDFKPGHWCLD